MQSTWRIRFWRLSISTNKLLHLEAKKAELDSEIRTAGRNAMIKSYKDEKSFPGTIVMDAGSAHYQFITSDRYTKVDQEQAEYLTEKYGEQIVTEDTTFAFNPKVLKKYQDEISAMIMNSDMPDDAKAELIVSTTSRAVTKGTIKNLMNPDYAKFDVTEIIDDIRPIFSIKSVSEK